MNEQLPDLLIEFDEMGFAPTVPCSDLEKYAIEWREKVRIEFEHLKSENIKLKKQVQKWKDEAEEQKSIADDEHATQMEWFAKACEYKAENAELKARLEKAVELPEKPHSVALSPIPKIISRVDKEGFVLQTKLYLSYLCESRDEINLLIAKFKTKFKDFYE